MQNVLDLTLPLSTYPDSFMAFPLNWQGVGALRIEFAGLSGPLGDFLPEIYIDHIVFVPGPCNPPAVLLPPVSTVYLDQSNFITVMGNGACDTYLWQVDTGIGFADITDQVNYSGITSNALLLWNADTSYNGNLYRCIVTNSCGLSDTTNPTLLEVVECTFQMSISTGLPSDTVCDQSQVLLTASQADSYSWSTDASTQSTFVYVSRQPYTVSVTGDSAGCMSTANITLYPLPPIIVDVS